MIYRCKSLMYNMLASRILKQELINLDMSSYDYMKRLFELQLNLPVGSITQIETY